MGDLVFLLIVVAFFALAALFVVACDRIIGPDEPPDSLGTSAPPLEEVAAG